MAAGQWFLADFAAGHEFNFIPVDVAAIFSAINAKERTGSLHNTHSGSEFAIGTELKFISLLLFSMPNP